MLGWNRDQHGRRAARRRRDDAHIRRQKMAGKPGILAPDARRMARLKQHIVPLPGTMDR
jgi:hypothetical protein